MRVKVVETGGVSLTRQLFKTDSSGCLIPDCLLCESDMPGASHSSSCAVYHGECLLCAKTNVLASYERESGFNSAYCCSQHAADIRSEDLSNAFAKHLHVYHPINTGEVSAFKFKSVKTFSNKVPEETNIWRMQHQQKPCWHKMNGKAEWNQPSKIRVTFTRNTDKRVRTRSLGSWI